MTSLAWAIAVAAVIYSLDQHPPSPENNLFGGFILLCAIGMLVVSTVKEWPVNR